MNVSRETQERLDIYLQLLRKWSLKINLVSAASLENAAQRHFEDSMQIASLSAAEFGNWSDLGAGGGFPGAVIAILKAEEAPRVKVSLVESDQRKAAFLRNVSRETSVGFSVLSERIEEMQSLQSDVLSARALAPLPKLLEYTERHLKEGGQAYFPKGATWQQEVSDAQKQWRFSLKVHNSKTNTDAAILEIGNLSRA